MIEENNDDDQKLKDIIYLLWTEIKKDLPFFGGCGIIAMYLFRVEALFEQWFTSCGSSSLAEESFSGFISLGDYGLLMFGLMIIGSIANILYCFKKEYVWFNNIIKHVERRFTQLVSITISFSAGVISFALLHALVTVTSDGITLAVSIFLFMVLICITFLPVHIVTRRIGAYRDKWLASASVLVLSLVVLGLALTGCKILMYTFGLIFALLVFLVLGYRKWRERKQQQV